MAPRPSKIATPQRAKQFAEEDARYSNYRATRGIFPPAKG